MTAALSKFFYLVSTFFIGKLIYFVYNTTFLTAHLIFSLFDPPW